MPQLDPSLSCTSPRSGGPLLESQRSSLLLILGDQVIELEERLARMQARADTLQEELDHATCQRSRGRLTRLFLAFPVFLPLSVSASIPECACPCMCGYLLASVRSVCLNLHSRDADFQGRSAKGILSPQKVEKCCLPCFPLSTLE